ncbi:unnamed protein product [Cuscuta campestris]|uniref:Uncharacterized protein n=1 Tax=Cuscuta campestris TaxID=132261 RepID=A0A484MYL5_9ASTE|nr:unnamed protein product [Cuscuta campestris]
MRCDLQENDSQTFVRYLFGLNTQIANTVELQTFENLEELTKLALKVEAQLKKGKSSLSRGNSSYPSTSNSTPLAAQNLTDPSPQNPKTENHSFPNNTIQQAARNTAPICTCHVCLPRI